jgi:hypothetical protein
MVTHDNNICEGPKVKEPGIAGLLIGSIYFESR